MVIYFWSDTHFNHRAILDYCARGFATVEEMCEVLVARWNHAVGPKDTVYHLGDFAFSGRGLPSPQEIFDRLHGYKHLVVGNHDEKNPKVLDLPWQGIEDIQVVRWEGRKFVLCHYPLEAWPSGHHGALHLHGHCHGTLKRVLPHRFDVGVDVFPSGPVRIDFFVAEAERQVFVPTDHHGAP